MSLIGRVAIVTGAASGIGAATARALSEEGAKVVLVDKDEAKLNEVAEQFEKDGNKHLIIKADITKDGDVRSIVEETINNFGELHVLINNAGIARYSAILDEKLMETFDLLIDTNLRSMVHLTHLSAPHLIRTKGNIVNISSIAAFSTTEKSHMPYAIAKAGVTHFTRCVALDLASHGVRVNAVAPGCTKTKIMENSGMTNVDDAYEAWRKERTALKRIAEPEEIADIIVFLVSDKARSITGSTFVSDNGALLL